MKFHHHTVKSPKKQIPRQSRIHHHAVVPPRPVAMSRRYVPKRIVPLFSMPVFYLLLFLAGLLGGWWLVLADAPSQPSAPVALSVAPLRMVAVTTLALTGYVALLGAARPVEAIFAFLVYLGALLLAFFSLGADYVGAIHLLVYPGAILIFFVFATLTTDQQGRWQRPGDGSWIRTTALAIPLGWLWWGSLANSLGGVC
jgi:hypothetical protein